MKVFVTVGTTPFDSLIRHIDETFRTDQHEVTLQIANGNYIPKRFPFFRFVNNIESFYKSNDIVITHAGAGSIYKLLEIGKEMIIVPNMDRIDKHQMDIAKSMYDNEYAVMCVNFSELSLLIDKAGKFKLRKFKKDKFFGHLYIKEMIERLYN